MLYNKTFQVTEPITVICEKETIGKSQNIKGIHIAKQRSEYLMTHVMPGYNLIGIICETGTLHYLRADDFSIKAN